MNKNDLIHNVNVFPKLLVSPRVSEKNNNDVEFEDRMFVA